MKNLIITIALILCIFGVFMVKLNDEASTIPEVEEWVYLKSYQEIEFFSIHSECDIKIGVPEYEVFITLNFSQPLTIKIISEDAKDTIYVTWKMIEKVFGN